MKICKIMRRIFMGKNIGFIGTRFAGTDGVSLESEKWAQVLEKQGHSSYWFAGELDRPEYKNFPVPEAHFMYPRNQVIQKEIFGSGKRIPKITEEIHSLRIYLKEKLYEFIKKFDINLIIPQNSLSIPMQIPLGLSITEFIAETGIPAIAHHHDFSWERARFTRTGVKDYLDMAFPPDLPSIAHVVINFSAQKELAFRKGISSVVIPNVLDFSHPPEPDDYSRDFRENLGILPDDILILQPVRVLPRKGIEHAIDFVSRFNDPKMKLLISHEAGDEGTEYFEWLKDLAKSRNVKLLYIADRIDRHRRPDHYGNKRYNLPDIYLHADFVTYPSLYEGFGNAFLEAVYFQKPLMVNRYPVFVSDIEPCGFDLVLMDGFITRSVVEEAGRVMKNPERREKMVRHNYKVALKHFSCEVLYDRLKSISKIKFGIDL